MKQTKTPRKGRKHSCAGITVSVTQTLQAFSDSFGLARWEILQLHKPQLNVHTLNVPHANMGKRGNVHPLHLFATKTPPPRLKAMIFSRGRESAWTTSWSKQNDDSKGRTLDDNMYSGGCLFYNHASGHIEVEFQIHFTTAETIQAKQHCERNQLDRGVIIQAYHTDNGTLNAKEFVKEIYDKHQSIQFSGSGAHHQN
jgi:hypothetical protein